MPRIEPHDLELVKRALSSGSEAMENPRSHRHDRACDCKGPAAAKAKAAKARDIVQQRQREAMAVLTASLKKASRG